MNKLSDEQKNYLLNQYEITIEVLEYIEDTLHDLNIQDFEYFLLVSEIVSEYQSFIFNKELEKELYLANLIISEIVEGYQNFIPNKNTKISLYSPYNNLKDIIIKVLKYKLISVVEENSKYENEVNSLILRLTDK